MRSAMFCIALSVFLCPALAQDDQSSTAVLDKLSVLPKPSQQNDLDTVSLASAHRERAASVDEKTDGLWQSWLVSICEGCSPERRQFTDRDGEQYLKTLRDQQRNQGEAGKPKYSATTPKTNRQPDRSRSLSADLSKENIEQIRRDPNHSRLSAMQ